MKAVGDSWLEPRPMRYQMALNASSCYCELSSRTGAIPVRGMLCLGEAYAL